MKNNPYHTPVLLKEAIDALNIQEGGKYIDGTLGGGGHSQLILDKGGEVMGIDQDMNAINESRKRFQGNEKIRIVKGNFRDVKRLAEDNGFNKCLGILLDLGTSTYQLKGDSRGFSFTEHTKLDMRMDKDLEVTAFDLVNKWPKSELVNIFEKYGEENEAGTIAEEIVRLRKTKEIIYADELAGIISSVKNRKEAGIHPATKVFQALRIAVNDELDVLRKALQGSIDILDRDGRLVVISFHSLEDRIVKNVFNDFERKQLGKIIIKKPVKAGFLEIKQNKRARSAKMRVFEKN